MARPIHLQLLGGFAVSVDGEPLSVSRLGQRCLARLALLGRSADRGRLAETLWPDSSPQRGLANLRGTLWRMPEPVRSGIETDGLAVSLGDRWHVDLDDAWDRARQLSSGATITVDRSLFSADLLPEWDDEWLLIRRERHRQLRLHALEDLAAAQIRASRPLDAVETALQAVEAEPLRESAQLLLLRAHLAAGNRAAAIRQFDRFRVSLADALDVDPSGEMSALIATVGRRAG